MVRSVFGCALVLIASAAQGASPSPHVGQESREVKALSPQEIADYLGGKGMGLAKTAELNGYPGPAHVLELAPDLGLTEEQQSRTEALFQKMRARAIPLGTALVEEERALDRLFASRAVTSESLRDAMLRIGRLQAEVRQAHLDAHIEQTMLLTPAQIETYNQLRGYETAAERKHQHPPH
jgi:Spy/CpxP family protein refolding chaperone